MLMMRTFFATLVREWGKMDKYRIDKFYTLSRYMIREIYRYMAERQWSLGIINLFNAWTMQLKGILRRFGMRSVRELVGRSDLLVHLDYDNDGLLDVYAVNGFISGPLLDDV